MGRTRPLLLIAVAVIGFAIGCRKAAPPATVPPEVYVSNVNLETAQVRLQKTTNDVARYIPLG